MMRCAGAILIPVSGAGSQCDDYTLNQGHIARPGSTAQGHAVSNGAVDKKWLWWDKRGASAQFDTTPASALAG
jgi:hypothetical protein